jgi:hypothetical protein
LTNAPDPESANRDLRARAAKTAQHVIDAAIGPVDGARQLREDLSRLGDFDKGEFSGDFSAITFFCFETDPYPSESQRSSWTPEALAESDRWLPTLVARHRTSLLAACRRVIDKYR